MRELCWRLWKQRGALFVIAVGVATCAIMVYQVMELYGCGLFELCYRTAFVVLLLVFAVLQREQFSIVLRKERSHRFYRSMPHAWEKEQKRLLWIDVFGAFGVLVLLIVGLRFCGKLSEAGLPYALVVFFLVYMVSSRLLVCVPYVWWLAEVVFGLMFVIMSGMDVSPLLCAGTAVVAGGVQGLLCRLVRKLWYMEN